MKGWLGIWSVLSCIVFFCFLCSTSNLTSSYYVDVVWKVTAVLFLLLVHVMCKIIINKLLTKDLCSDFSCKESLQLLKFLKSLFVIYQETLDSLAEMYSLLNEEDMWAGLWQQRCRYPETATAIAYETQGFYEQAQSAYEMVSTHLS